MDCIFCKIIAEQIPVAKVYEDDKALAFLDIKPVNFGHTLIIPKSHYQLMTDTPDELLGYLFVKAKEMMAGIKKALNADFVTVSVVGVEVPHFHIHLVPRYYNDGLANWWPTKNYEAGQLEEIAVKIKAKLLR